MKTTITKAQLAEATGAVKGLVSKDGLSAFSKVRLDASGCLSVTGSNGDVQVEWRLDGEIKDRGTVTVPGAAFASFVGAMPEGVVEIEECAGRSPRVRMEGGGVKFTLKSGEAADFPMMAGPKDEAKAALHIDAVLFREMLRKVRFAVSTGATRKSLEGVNIDLKDGKLGMTAIDGRRLAHVEKEITPDGAGESGQCNITLPTKTVAILYGLLERMDEDSDVDVLFDGTAVRIVGDKWGMTAKVLADKYPNWRQVVPEKPQHKAELKRGAFLEAMGRAALASDESSGVKITLKNTSAAFEAKNDITAASASMAACKMDEGVKGEFRMNPRLMKDALEAIDEDDFTLHFDEGDGKPIKLTCALPWVAVVMPYRKEG